MATPKLGFGIEIEAVLVLKEAQQAWGPVQCYKQLADALRRNDLPAIHDPGTSGYRKHPEHYSRWYITRDGSLRQSSGCVSVEAVSPIMNPGQEPWEQKIKLFWETLKSEFEVKKDLLCGSHIHIAPIGRKYTLGEVKQIAFAVCYYEPYVVSILPPERRDNSYCKRNSNVAPRMGSLFRQRSPEAWKMIAKDIKGKSTHEEVCIYLQDGIDSSHRFVLWNFQNLVAPVINTRPPSGTIEFRGGRHLRGKVRTIRWVTFVIVFISMALRENLVDSASFSVPSNARAADVSRFWSKVREYARRLHMEENIPPEFKMMSEKKRST